MEVSELAKKFAPTAIVAAVAGYCCWCCLGVPQPGEVPLEEDDSLMITQSLLSPDIKPVPKRNPFLPSYEAETASTNGEGPGAPAPQKSLADILNSLMLNATYIQGSRRLAMIDGRVYEQGEPLTLAEPAAGPCVVARISADKVLIRHHGGTMELKYRNPAPKTDEDQHHE